MAALALEQLDVSLQIVREKVLEVVGVSTTMPDGSPPFTPRAKKVLELSLREALQLGHNYIGTEHILLGLLREGDGVAPQVLVGLGVGLTTVREQVMQVLEGYRAQKRPTPSAAFLAQPPAFRIDKGADGVSTPERSHPSSARARNGLPE